MKKLLFSFIACFCILFQGSAETFDDETLPADRNHLTVTVAYDASLPGKWKTSDGSFKIFKSGSGVSAGVDFLMLLGNNLFFEPGARLYIDSYSYNNVTVGSGTVSDPAMTIDAPVRKTGLRVPLTFGYKFDIFSKGSLLLSTGPEPVIGFSARTKLDEELSDSYDENLYKNLMHRFDVAWDIRAAVVINRFRVDLTGGFGLLDVLKTDASMHEYRVSVGLGYIF